jgi:hypothetical protein
MGAGFRRNELILKWAAVSQLDTESGPAEPFGEQKALLIGSGPSPMLGPIGNRSGN